MKNTLSYWERQAFFRNVDVAVIGSGIIGLTAAIRLKELNRKLRVIVIERGALPEGASTRNAGFACFGSLTELISDLSTHTEDEVWELVEKRWKGLARLRARVGDARLKYKGYGGYEIFRPEDAEIFEGCVEKMDWFNHHIGRITNVDEVYKVVPNTFGFQYILRDAILNRAEGQIDTGAMMITLTGLARQKGVQIFNGWEVGSIVENGKGVEIVAREGWSVQVKKAIVATNGFARRLLPQLDVVPARNQVLITKPVPKLRLKGAFHYDQGYYYFRNIDSRILLGGGRNVDFKNEETDEWGQNPLIQNTLKEILQKIILPGGKVEIEGWWSGILGLGSQKKPIIQYVSPNIIAAVRMGGMGVAIGSLVGEEAALLLMQGAASDII